MKRISSVLAVVGLVLTLVWVLNDPMDEETALFRSGASTEEVLAARETYVPPERPTWMLIAGIALMIPLGFSFLRRQLDHRR